MFQLHHLVQMSKMFLQHNMALLISREKCVETKERTVWLHSKPIDPKFSTIPIWGFALSCVLTRLSGLFSLIYVMVLETLNHAKSLLTLVSRSSGAVWLLAILEESLCHQG